MDKDSLFMVTNDSPYTQWVPIQLGTLHIREAMQLATKEEKQTLSPAWVTASFAPQALSKAGVLNEPNFDLDQVNGKVKLTKAVVIKPFQMVHVSGHIKCKQHFKRVNVIVESDPERNYRSAILVNGYTVLKPGSSRVSIGIRNISCQSVTILAKTVIAKIAAANVVPHSYAPNVESNEQLQRLSKLNSKEIPSDDNGTGPGVPLETSPLTPEREQLLFSKINLGGIKDWTDDLKSRTQELFKEYTHVFALESLDMGHTSLVKHKIKLDNYTPFKERYRCIPQNLFEKVKNHLMEMIQVGAIRCSNSPWANAVVLVRKKDGSLRFCIDLRRLNARTIKDAYSLLRIDETLDCLGGAIIFTSLDLKSGYWQVEMDEESKALTAFMVGPLGFYECDRMPFGLTNALATFQHLMESCLGELHLNWCIIYLDDIIVFSKTPEEHLK